MARPLSLNNKLHLVVPIYDNDDGDKITGYVHSTPISRETFEAHFMLVSRTFSAIFEGGGAMGPRVATLMLQKIAESSNDPTEAMALMNEIRRLTNVVARGPNGWESTPFQDAVDHKTLSDDDIAEVSNAIVYFMLASAILRKRERKVLTESVTTLGAQTSFSNFTAFVASLGTSIDDAPITPKIPVSSVVF
jgi:hypothetical protein